MQDFVPERDERASLKALLAALDASERALRRDPPIRGQDDTGGWSIRGRLGHIHPDGTGYLLCVVSDYGTSRPGAGLTSRLGLRACAS
jgi:hypothetical protein